MQLLALEVLVVGWIFPESFSHFFLHQHWIFDLFLLLKWFEIRPRLVKKFVGILNVAVTPLYFLATTLCGRVSTPPLRRIPWPLMTYFVIDLPNHIFHFTFTLLKGIIWMLILYIYFSCYFSWRKRLLCSTLEYVRGIQQNCRLCYLLCIGVDWCNYISSSLDTIPD